MLRPSAKTVILSARPSRSVSSSTRIESRPGRSAGAGYGYSVEPLTQSRPRASNAMFIGFWISGSAAKSWTRNPGGRWNDARSCSGVRASVGRIAAANGSSAARAVTGAISKAIASIDAGVILCRLMYQRSRRRASSS